MNVRKALAAALRPRFWPALARGVVPTIEHRAALSAVDPRTVIDVGANKGQFSLFAAARWPNADIIAFEPLPKPGSIYRRVVPGRARLLACALGAEAATLEMHVATRDDSSSLLPLGELQRSLFAMDEASTIAVPVDRLDQVLDREDAKGPMLLKIDVQGFEYEVLEGLGDRAGDVPWLYVEVSFRELYTGQKLFPELERLAHRLGYRCAGLFNELVHQGERVQADALFVRGGV